MNNKIKRVLAAYIDFFIICFLSTVVVGALTLGEFSVTIISVIVYITVFLLLLLLKDCVFKNASIGKRIFKLKIVKTDETKLMIIDIIKRNILLVILMAIESILLITNDRRIGDVWANTVVIYNNEAND